MKRVTLLTLASAICFGGCYGGANEQVLNPYDLNKKQPLVQKADDPVEAEQRPATEAPQVAESPAPAPTPLADPDSRYGNPAPTDLAEATPANDDAFAPDAIDPRLRGGAEASRYAPVQPRTVDSEPAMANDNTVDESVRPTAGETELAAPDRSNDQYAPLAPPSNVDQAEPRSNADQADPSSNAEQVDPSAVASSEEQEAPAAEPVPAPAAQPAQPNVGDLAGSPPSSLKIPENIPSIADIPPSLTEPEVNSVNKPPLNDVPNAAEPAAERRRPSDLLLERSANAPDPVVEDPVPVKPAEQPPQSPTEIVGSETVPQSVPQSEPTQPADDSMLPLDKASEIRTWVDNTGRLRIKARFVQFEEGNVYLRTDDGDTLKIPMSRFSRRDQDFLNRIERGDFGI